MNFTAPRSTLAAALGAAVRAVVAPTTIPVLGNLRLVASPGELAVTGTDMDVEVTARIAADVVTPGETTVPASRFEQITRKLPDGAVVTVALADQAREVKITAGRARFALPVLPVEDFPSTVAMIGEAVRFEIEAPRLAALLAPVEHAQAKDAARYYLNGVYLWVDYHQADGGPALFAVGTDGHRLAETRLPAPAGVAGMPGVILPRKAVAEVLRLAREAKAPKGGEAPVVAVDLTDTRAAFDFGNVRLATKLIDGTFPDYRRVIPADHEREAVVDRALFAAVVDRLAAMTSDKSSRVVCRLSPGEIALEVAHPDAGTGREEFAADYEGDAFEIGFSHRYMVEALNSFEAETVRLFLKTPGDPVRIEPVTRPLDAPGLVVIVMPMRV
jgi:DNA polymerase-3 subunit beta